MTDAPFELTTRRLNGGPVADALNGSASPACGLFHAVLTQLDGEEGWIAQGENADAWWFPDRLAVRVWWREQEDDPGFVQLDVHVVHDAELTDSLLEILSDLNAHAAGWWWWWHEGVIRCSARCVAAATTWWWPLALLEAAPIAVTVSESMADELARVSGGQVSAAEHPARGSRPNPDGWISGTRLGARDPTAALGHPLLPKEFERFRTGLGVLTHEDAVVDHQRNGLFLETDPSGGVIGWRPHWHAQLGWGWQFATVTAFQPMSGAGRHNLYVLASELNTAQAMNGDQGDCLGGWTVIPDLGLTHVTFVPAVTAAQVCAVAGPTVGDALVVMLDLRQRIPGLEQALSAKVPEDCERRPVEVDDLSLALGRSSLTTGIIGWSYVEPGGQSPEIAPTEDAWTDQVPLQDWTVPRQDIVCSWGIFNPMGPTIGSLEIAWSAAIDGLVCSLYHVLRHPHRPQIQLLGSVTGDALPAFIEECLGATAPELLGSGPEWVDIFAFEEHVLAGLRAFAGSRPDEDWLSEAKRLTHFALYPWARLDGEQPPVETWPEGLPLGPVDAWVEAITNPVVVLGHNMFLRSAWEGAKAYRESNWDPKVARSVVDRAMATVHERYSAAFGV